MGITDAGIFGDILCARMKVRGVAALVTDGVVRDVAGVLDTGLPVWCKGAAAPPSVAGLTFVNWQQPIGCGGVAVFPDDVIVVDEDGAVVIPRALLNEVVEAAAEQEKLEAWIMGEVKAGTPLPGLYPPNAETKARYEAFRNERTKAFEIRSKSSRPCWGRLSKVRSLRLPLKPDPTRAVPNDMDSAALGIHFSSVSSAIGRYTTFGEKRIAKYPSRFCNVCSSPPLLGHGESPIAGPDSNRQTASTSSALQRA